MTSLLLIGALLQLQSIQRQQTIDYGYDTSAILGSRMGLMEGDYPTSERRQLFYERLMDPADLEPQFRRRVAGFRTGSGTFRMNVALSELPDVAEAIERPFPSGEDVSRELDPRVGTAASRRPFLALCGRRLVRETAG